MAIPVSRETLLTCCHSGAWADAVLAKQPFQSMEKLIEGARSAWWNETPITGWLEAFAAHPRLGDRRGLAQRSGAFSDLSRDEQSSAAGAAEATLAALADWNARYEARFGHIFIACAAGTPADRMLAMVKQRYTNDPATELSVAAGEQMKITELRLAKLVGAVPSPANVAARRTGQLQAHLDPPGESLRSPITTHVLDTARGKPASGVRIVLERAAPGSSNAWQHVGAGKTNGDGRVPDLLPPAASVAPGVYRITFDTSEYMRRCRAEHPAFFPAKPFYPRVSVFFEILESQVNDHFHVPLTWNPYGYSTYRGS
uniref:Uncharacterized protein n=1 Tax=Auxenochlorella protothecoides TaxID=3075 RepID=A0A1D1ZY42_AUXPR